MVGAQVGDEFLQAGPGTVLIKPRGVPHAFWNPADQPARLLEIIPPGGFEHYFADMAGVFAAPGPPDAGALAAVAGRYDLDVDLSSVAGLAAAHGLQAQPAPG